MVNSRMFLIILDKKAIVFIFYLSNSAGQYFANSIDFRAIIRYYIIEYSGAYLLLILPELIYDQICFYLLLRKTKWGDFMQEITNENRVNDKASREIEIDVVGLLRAIFKKLWVIILVALVCGGIMFGLSEYVIQPTYRAYCTAYVNNKNVQSGSQQITNSDMNAQHQLAATYSTILTSNTVLTAAAESINLDYPYSRLKSMVKTSEKDETGVIEISVISKSKDLSFMLADAISKVAPTYMADMVEGSSMKIVDHPEYPKGKYAPNTSRYTLLGALAGALLTLIIVIIRHFTDDTLSSETYLEQNYSMPIIGIIPDFTKIDKQGKGAYSYGYAYKRSSSKEEKDNG